MIHSLVDFIVVSPHIEGEKIVGFPLHVDHLDVSGVLVLCLAPLCLNVLPV